MMETPAHIVTSSAIDFQRDLSRYWRHVRKQGGVTLTSQGWIYKSSFKSFLAVLNVAAGLNNNEEQSNGKLWFMRRLLVQMRELSGDNFADTLVATTNSRLLGMTTAQRVRWVFEHWRDSGAWNELLRLPGQNVSFDHRRDASNHLAKARQGVLKALTKLHSGKGIWEDPAALVAHLKKNDYGFLFERKRGYGVSGMYASPYYSSNNPYGISFTVARDEASGWDVVERAFVIQLLTGPLYWLGLVDIGYSGADQPGEGNAPAAYRISEVGAWLLGLAEQPTFVESGGRVVVQPNFNVLAMEPISDIVLVDLDHFADSLGGDRAVTYELSKDSLYRGQQAGWSAERVTAFLEKHQGGPLPSNVARTLTEWETTHRRITFHRKKLVVQFADEDADVQASLVLTPFKPHQLADKFYLLPNADYEKTGAALREAGWMPTLQPHDSTGLDNSLRADEDGSLSFLQSAPSVFALGKLAQFADAGESKITPASVRVAMNNHLDVEQVLALLGEMHAGPVPQALEKSIRKWAGFFGQGSLRQVVLLELSNLDVMANLIADPVVGVHLHPIDGSARPLALVDADHVDAIRALLEERGVAVG
jgi:hypothetical protein